MKKVVSGKVIFIGVLALIMAIVCLCPVSAGFVRAESYDGVDISSLWYYGESGLQIDSAKAVVNDWLKAENKGKLKKKVIAVIDTGIDYKHEVFDGVLYTNSEGKQVGYDARQWQGYPNGLEVPIENLKDDAVNSDNKLEMHGNAVAGVLAIMIKELGLQDYIKIYPIKANKVENGKDEKNTFLIPSVVNAINQAKKIGADVINMSLGIRKGVNAEWAEDEDLKYALESAGSDIFIVAAAGNDGKDADTYPNYTFYPAAHDGVFGVMAYNQNGLYSKSNYGSVYGIAAPGEHIYTAKYVEGQKYDRDKDGTSLATPLVAFAGALLKLRFEADGKIAPKGNDISRIMRNLDCRTVKKGNHDIKCLDYNTIVTQDFDETEFYYDAPTEITLSHNGKYGDKDSDYAKTIYMRASSATAISFIAKINPYGYTDPALDSALQWILKRADETEEVLGRGLKLDYKPTYIDETVTVIARLQYGDKTLEQSQTVYLQPSAFLVGEVRVTYAKKALKSVDEAPGEGIVYTGETTVFSLTGIEYIGEKNRSKITWYVDGKLAGEGAVFNYKPKTTGKHVISARYDGSPIPREFTANVKPFIARPLDLSMLIIGLLIVLGTIVTGSVIYAKRKNGEQVALSPENKQNKIEEEE